MTSSGSDHSIVKADRRRLQLLVATHLLWIVFFVLLVGWWGRLLLDQADLIEQLENAAGVVGTRSYKHVRRMVLWESSVLAITLVTSTTALLWLYWRDERRLRSFRVFFASLTHELRTPLSSVRLQAESLADHVGASPQAKELTKRLLEDTQRLEGQVDRALALARLEGGGRLFPRSVNLKAMLERYTQGLAIPFQGEMTDLEVMADPIAFQMILKNIVENTRKHSGAEIPTIQFRCDKENGAVTLWLQDGGSGSKVSPHSLGSLFLKGEHSTGAGVGLFLIRSLMEAMGGSAVFRNEGGFSVGLIFMEGEPAHE